MEKDPETEADEDEKVEIPVEGSVGDEIEEEQKDKNNS
jgi:hypothetical protein